MSQTSLIQSTVLLRGQSLPAFRAAIPVLLELLRGNWFEARVAARYCWLALLMPLLSVKGGAAPATYYVDGTAGNDANAGKSLTSAWRTLQKACEATPPNSIVLVRGGTYHENLVVSVSGTADQPIYFRPYATEAVVVDGQDTPGTALLRITNQRSLRFENFTFQNLTAANAQGILVETTGTATSTDLVFRHITIRRIGWTASKTQIPTATDNAQGFIAYGRQGGITKLTLDSCEVYDNILGFSEALTLDGNVNGFTISHCLIHDNTNIGIDLAGHYKVSPDPTTDQARNGIVQDNVCYRNVSAYATSAGIYVDGGRDILLDRNRCYQNGWGIEVGAEENGTVTNITVTNNLLYRNQQAGMSLGGYSTKTTGQVLSSLIRNNTFLLNNTLNDGTGELTITKASGCRLENNVFYTTDQGTLFSVENIDPQASNKIDYSIWYTPANDPTAIAVNWRGTTYSSFGAYQSGTGQEAHSRYAEPGLVNAALVDAHLRPTSVCRASGNPATVFRSGETDLDGRPRVGGSSVEGGAFVYAAISGSSIVTGLASERATGLTIFPVPAQSALALRVPFAHYVVEIYTSQGRLVGRVENSPSVISTQTLAAGAYSLVVLGSDGTKLSSRFIKD